MLEKNIENTTKSESNFAQTFVDHQLLPDININGNCLINNISIPKKVISPYISYTLSQWLRNLNADFTLGNFLYVSVKLTKNADPDKQVYTGYGIRFDSCSEFSLSDGSMGKIVLIFGADMSSSVHIDNNRKNILIFGEGPIQGLDDTTLIAINSKRQIFY